MQTAIEKALELKNLAVVGLSKDPAKAAHSVPRYLQTQGYKIYPVNPFGGVELLGEKVYNKVSEIDEKIDLVVVFRPSAEAAQVVKDALKRDDIQGVWLQEGIVSEKARDLVAERSLIFVEDRCTYKEHRRLKNSR